MIFKTPTGLFSSRLSFLRNLSLGSSLLILVVASTAFGYADFRASGPLATSVPAAIAICAIVGIVLAWRRGRLDAEWRLVGLERQLWKSLRSIGLLEGGGNCEKYGDATFSRDPENTPAASRDLNTSMIRALAPLTSILDGRPTIAMIASTVYSLEIDGVGSYMVKRRDSPLLDREAVAFWIEVSKELTPQGQRSGRRILTFKLPSEIRKFSEALVIVKELNKRTGGQNYRLKLLPPPYFGPGRCQGPFYGALLAALLPLLGIIAIFSLIESELNTQALIDFSGHSLGDLILFVGLTVPWITACVSGPVYAAVGRDIEVTGGDVAIGGLLLKRLPVAIFVGALLSAVFGIILGYCFGWGESMLSTYTVASALTVMMSLALIYVHLAQRPLLWLTAWVAYGTCFYLAPTLWYLPPMAATLVALSASIREAIEVKIPRTMIAVPNPTWKELWNVFCGYATALLLGFLFSAPMWCDKVGLVLDSPEILVRGDLFLAMLPAGIALIYHNSRNARRLSLLLSATINQMYFDCFAVARFYRKCTFEFAIMSLREMLILGATFGAMTIVYASFSEKLVFGDFGVMVLASLVLAAGSIILSSLLSLGSRRFVNVYGAFHLASIVLVIVLPLRQTTTIVVLFIVATIGLVVLGRRLLQDLRFPEFSAFWQQQSRLSVPP